MKTTTMTLDQIKKARQAVEAERDALLKKHPDAYEHLERWLTYYENLNAKLTAWLNQTKSRYNDVKTATEAYLKKHGKLLPPDFKDFMRWLSTQEEFKQTKIFSEFRINDVHLLEYSNYREGILNGETKQAEQPNYKVEAFAIKQVVLFRSNKGEAVTPSNKTEFAKAWHCTPDTAYNKFLKINKDFKTLGNLTGSKRGDNERLEAFEQAVKLMRYDDTGANKKLETICQQFKDNFRIKYG